VTEAVDPDQQLYGLARLTAALEGLGPTSPEAAIQAVLDSVDGFAREAPQADDITAVCLRFLGPAGAP